MIEAIKNKFNELDPKTRYRITIGTIGLVGFGLLWMFVTNTDGMRTSDPERDHTFRITDEDLSAFDLEAVDQRVSRLEQTTMNIEDQLEVLVGAVREDAQERRDAAEAAPEIERLERRLQQLEEATEIIGEMAAQRIEQPLPVPIPRDEEPASTKDEEPARDEDDPYTLDEADVWSAEPHIPRPEVTSTSGEQQQETGIGETRIYGGRPEEETAEGDEEETVFAHLTAGSILSGQLLSGLDAPTNQSTRSDPFPVLIRVQKEAILPNRFRADVRECFVIGEAYGDLSSERAYMRGNTISCVLEDGGVIEQRIPLFAAGEDGKAGVRGRLVSKQGAVLARAMMAGFLEGVSNAFQVQNVPAFDLNAGSNVLTQDMFSENALRGGAATGTSRALDRLSQFYIDMAEGMFPVIEIDAGRQVDLIATEGTTLSASTSSQ